MDLDLLAQDAGGPGQSNERTIQLKTTEAAYLALYRKGHKEHKPSLLEAIRIMIDFSPAVTAKEEEQKNKRQRLDCIPSIRRLLISGPNIRPNLCF